MIPDEAVEAAFSRMPYQAADYIDTDTMREILEAAAPHILADAWDEGVSDGQWNAEHIYQVDAGLRRAIENPYRSQA